MKAKTLIVAAVAAIMVLSAMVLIFYPAAGAQQSSATPATETGGYVTIYSYGTPHTYYAGIIATNGSTYNSAPSGMDVGIYVPSYVHGVTINGAVIHDENNYGIYSLGSGVTIENTNIYNTGNHAGAAFSPNGAQTGVGIVTENGNNVNIMNNVITQYQKGGIAVINSQNVAVTGNTVTGLGHVDFIAQNGVEIGYGASVSVRGNIISGNYYSGSGWVSVGLLLYGENPSMEHISLNHFRNNQVGFDNLPSQLLTHNPHYVSGEW